MTFGMDVVESEGATGYYDSNLEGKMTTMASAIVDYDFGFVHVKAVDDAGHDKSLSHKVEQLSKSDKAIGTLLDSLHSDFILCVTGDHTTPVNYGDHSHEPVPIAIGRASDIRNSLKSPQIPFDEIAMSRGRLGRFSGHEIMGVLKAYREHLI